MYVLCMYSHRCILRNELWLYSFLFPHAFFLNNVKKDCIILRYYYCSCRRRSSRDSLRVHIILYENSRCRENWTRRFFTFKSSLFTLTMRFLLHYKSKKTDEQENAFENGGKRKVSFCCRQSKKYYSEKRRKSYKPLFKKEKDACGYAHTWSISLNDPIQVRVL